MGSQPDECAEGQLAYLCPSPFDELRVVSDAIGNGCQFGFVIGAVRTAEHDVRSDSPGCKPEVVTKACEVRCYFWMPYDSKALGLSVAQSFHYGG